MVDDKHTPFRENISAYVIGALNADEIAALEAHLEKCASCRTELAEYRAVSESLLMAVSPKQPSVMLRKRLQSQLPNSRKKASFKFTWNFYRFAAGVAVIALLTLNLASLNQTRQIQTQQAELVSKMNDAQVALAMLSYPGVERVSVYGADLTGSFLLDGDRNIAVLIVWEMPQLSEDQTYQVWLIDPQGGRVSAGVFSPQTDRAFTTQVITTNKAFSNYVGIGVTVEPAGGSDQPTGERVLKIDF